jgi:5-oxoprolinase (ATP-hydrolysing)
MSNTRLTDIEVLERRAPVVVRTLEVRRGSGGAGASRGGDGLMRGYEFLAPVSLSHFASRRRHAPRGVLGGGDGLVGCAKALLSGELREFDAGVLSLELDAGDTFTVFTPGGGGYGAP